MNIQLPSGKRAGVADHLPKSQIVGVEKAWKAKEGSAVFYGNDLLQPRYFRLVLKSRVSYKKFLSVPSETSNGVLFIM
jgi:hypothetical protein